MTRWLLDQWVGAQVSVGGRAQAECVLMSSHFSPALAYPIPHPSDDERMLVEPACGAALAAVYSGILGRLQAEGHLPSSLASVVLIVCGGNSISSRDLQELQVQLGQK